MFEKNKYKLPDPKTMECNVHKITKIKILPDKEEDGRIFVEVDDGWCWQGMLVKDIYRDKEWHKLLFKIKPLYLAFYGGWNTTLRIAVWYNNEWCKIWDANNHFESLKAAASGAKAYEYFIQEEGKKIANLINEGKTLDEIDKAISDQHSGNTYFWALNIGINAAKNKENAHKVRLEHNRKHGIDSDKGLVNPSVLVFKDPKATKSPSCKNKK